MENQGEINQGEINQGEINQGEINQGEINQGETDPREILGPIAHIYRTHLVYMAKELETYGVGSGQFEFLLILYNRDGVSQEALAKMLKVSKATSTRAIQNLEKEGYVYRQRDENDLRAYRVYLTEKGKEMRDLILEKLISFMDVLFSDFTPEEKEIFRLLLHKAAIKLFEPGFEPPPERPAGSSLHLTRTMA